MSTIIYHLNGNDKTLILDTRASLLQPFQATNWTDLRLSMMLSVTKQSDPNDPTGLSETIGAGEDNNHFYIGFKGSDSNFPASSNFFGVTDKDLAHPTSAARMYDIPGNSVVAVTQATGSSRLLLSNGVTLQNDSIVSPSILFQDVLSGGQYPGYATLLILQMVRNDPTLNSIVSAAAVLQGNQFCAGTVFNSDTTIGNIRTLTAAATYTQAFGPFTFAFGSECDLRVLAPS